MGRPLAILVAMFPLLLSLSAAAAPLGTAPPDALYHGQQCPERIIDEGVRFRPGSARLRRSERAQLKSIATNFGDGSPILLLSVEGYQAIEEREEGLAFARAITVQDALIALGVPPARLVSLGHAAPPLWPGSLTQLGEKRVEFHVLLDADCTMMRAP